MIELPGINWKRPLGFEALVGVLLVAGGMTVALAWMLIGRVTLLQNGTEVLLKTAPVDPRDLLRGYYVQLTYDISRVGGSEEPDISRSLASDAYRRNDVVYVLLKPDADGFHAPVSVQREMPASEDSLVAIRGRVQYASCSSTSTLQGDNCHLQIQYGIEKFFAPQQRAEELEKVRSGPSQTRIDELNRRIGRLQSEQRVRLRKTELTDADRKIIADTDRLIAELNRQVADLRGAAAEDRQDVGQRFAVIARVSPTSGEAAISGLMLDGRRIYEERLF